MLYFFYNLLNTKVCIEFFKSFFIVMFKELLSYIYPIGIPDGIE